jgi:hypothetical protein
MRWVLERGVIDQHIDGSVGNLGGFLRCILKCG